MSEVVCPYCYQRTEFVSSAVVYGGRDYGMIYLCRDCKAWVGCHKGTQNPLGRLANAELREWRMKAHAAFDPIWKARLKERVKTVTRRQVKGVVRNSAYRWLALKIGIPREQCHIGMMDVEQCKRVVEVCESEQPDR